MTAAAPAPGELLSGYLLADCPDQSCGSTALCGSTRHTAVDRR